MTKSTLDVLARKYNTDKKIPDGKPSIYGSAGLGYSKYYTKLLKGRIIKDMLEIGVSFGASIKMFDEYFKGKCNIVGVDKYPLECHKRDFANKKNVKIIYGDQNDPMFLETLTGTKYDLIIDDGSHKPSHQLTSLCCLFPSVRYGGLYIIEDLHVNNAMKEVLSKHMEKLPKLTKLIDSVQFLCDDKIAVIHKKTSFN